MNAMTRSGSQYQPTFNPISLTPMMENLKVKNEPDEDAVLKQLKKMQANITIWVLGFKDRISIHVIEIK